MEKDRADYDVFINHRGPDTKNTIASLLYSALNGVGLDVFLDLEKHPTGNPVTLSPEIEAAINTSSVQIAIFSPRYAESSLCLEELCLMLKQPDQGAGNTIIPIFFDVKPSDLLCVNQGPYAEAFIQHKARGRMEVDKWEEALKQVAEITGHEFNTREEYWGKFVKKIVGIVLNEVRTEPLVAAEQQGEAAEVRREPPEVAEKHVGPSAQPENLETNMNKTDEDKLVQQVTEELQTYIIKDLYVAKYPVGLAARTSKVIEEFQGIADGQRRLTIGIWGMGGSGKTTLSKSVYNRIHHKFQASCFVADIRAKARDSVMGLMNLQKNVLTNLTRHHVDLYSVDQGKLEMQNCLASIKALVVLDDVDDDEQLDALFGDWYGPGSLIIITTRDKEVLQGRQVDRIQAMEGFSLEEGVKLFSWHAFGRESPEKDYEDMTKQIVHACDGLPLSLGILGAHLCSERNLTIWKEALQKIQNVGYDKLYKSLRISYDALTVHEKTIFLDIACFFIEFNRWSFFSKEFYIKFWEVLGRKDVHPSLKNLEGKSLIAVHENTNIPTRHGQIACEFRMHDHLRDLGRQIVEEESPDNPCIRSRLWHEEDIINAIDQAEESSIVQGIMWRGRDDFEAEQVDSLSSMHNLKFMFCWDLFLKREITKLPQNLRYLVLSECNLKQHTSFSKMSSLTESYSYFCSPMPKEIDRLKHLRYLDMSGTPLVLLPIELGQLLSLEELYLIRCSLIELPHSFGNLINLKFLDISENWLESFPANFSQLRSLEYLGAKHNDFEELPGLPGGLVHLDVRYSARLQKLPPISHITHLHTIQLCGCQNLKELSAFPSLSHMSDLETLDLSGCQSLTEIPNLDTMHSLRQVILDDCWNLEKLPILPSGLTHLNVLYCPKMKKLPSMSYMSDLETLNLSGCRGLTEIPNLDTMHSLRQLILDNCFNLEKLPALPVDQYIHVSTDNCFKLQYSSSRDKRKQPSPSPESNNEILLLDLKRRRVTEQSITFFKLAESPVTYRDVGELAEKISDRNDSLLELSLNNSSTDKGKHLSSELERRLAVASTIDSRALDLNLKIDDSSAPYDISLKLDL